MEGLPIDLQYRIWNEYYKRCVLPEIKTGIARRHYTNSVVPELKKIGEGMGRMWRAFISNDNVMIGVSRSMDDNMNEEEIRTYVASVAFKHVLKHEFNPSPIEIREIGSREIYVFNELGQYEGMYVSIHQTPSELI